MKNKNKTKNKYATPNKPFLFLALASAGAEASFRKVSLFPLNFIGTITGKKKREGVRRRAHRVHLDWP